MYRLFSALIGYLFGNFLFGYFYCKLHNVDIRTKGSGNVGATNTVRVMGVLPGILTLLSDCFKVCLAALASYLIFTKLGCEKDYVNLLKVYASAGAIIGHDFPFILKGKGGKGIASSLAFTCIVLPKAVPISVSIFIVTLLITKYVSLSSIFAAISICVHAVVFYIIGLLPYTKKYNYEVLIIVAVLSALAIYLHKGNIKRLLNGTENKLSFHKIRRNNG